MPLFDYLYSRGTFLFLFVTHGVSYDRSGNRIPYILDSKGDVAYGICHHISRITIPDTGNL